MGERVADIYLERVASVLLKAGHPRAEQILDDLRAHLRELEYQTGEIYGLQELIETLGAPEEYSESLAQAEDEFSEPWYSNVPPNVRYLSAVAAGLVLLLIVATIMVLPGALTGIKNETLTAASSDAAEQVAPFSVPPEATAPWSAPLNSPRGVSRPEVYQRPARTPAGTGPVFDNEDFVWCPPGNFVMGSAPDEKGWQDDEIQHWVTISRGFWIGKYEVTQEQWEAVMGSNPSAFVGANRPVEQVSWDDCQAYIRALNAIENRGYRLPTEAEWEYACRAGSTSAYCFGDNEADLGQYAVWGQNSGKHTHDAGVKKPNAAGVYDMHGNVWEWCQDGYESYPKDPVTDPVTIGDAPTRVIRGGSWNGSTANCRSANRNNRKPHKRESITGFRLVVPAG